ncbi:MAG: hypothetical protein IMZ61_06965 [Planctomycetes bacterium]|nr:hypothetical protein [Planctomycetota bacterium]
MDERKGKIYRDCELEIIMSLVPTSKNIGYLSRLLARSESAIKIVYKIAYESGPFGKNADIQEKKIIEAKNNVGIIMGRKSPRKKGRE